MAGAVINSLRYEVHDTGELPYGRRCAVRRLRWPFRGRERSSARNETIELMQKQSSSETNPSAPEPTAPTDLAAAAQRQRIIDAMVASCAEKTYAANDDQRHRRPRQHLPHHLLQALRRQARLLRRRGRRPASRRSAPSPRSPWPRRTRRRKRCAGRSAAMLELLAAKPALAQVLAAEAVAVDPTVVEPLPAPADPGAEGSLGRRAPTRPTQAHEPGAGLRPGAAAGPQPDRQRPRRAAARAASRNRLPRPRPVRRPRGSGARGAARRPRRRRATALSDVDRGPAQVAIAARPPRAPAGDRRTLPARAAAGGGGAGDDRQGL